MEGTFADPGFGLFRYLPRVTGAAHRQTQEYMPRDGLDSRDFTRVQEGIRGTAERSANIEGNNKFPRGARVRGTSNVHGGRRKKITDGL